MRYLPLIWAGLWRKPVRSVLTFLCVLVSFLLFGALHGVSAALGDIVSSMSDTRLRIQSRVNISEPLPFAHLARIERVDGVQGAGYYNFFGGYYQEPSNSFSSGAVDIARMGIMFPEINLAPDVVEKMKRTRDGAVIGEDLAKEYGWKVGDRIPLRSNVWVRKDGAPEWSFEIVGTYTWTNNIPSNELWMNYDYFDEARTFGNGTVTLYFARIADAKRAAAISDEIDRLFANSAFETQTQNERDWIRGRMSQAGDIGFFINAIIAAIMSALLLVTAFTMMQSVRERIPELAVLKTYGFGNGTVVSLVFGEALLICALAAGLGLTVAYFAEPPIYRMIGAGGLRLPWSVIGAGFALAAALAVVSSVLPARRAQTLNIVDALAAR
ncbi:MAG TPA: FtsX-like permease family protein [Gammaproteobacteria bacterium]|nr:FtsX-like permease family protein [Gammaproteobacteria bacterium]